MKIIIAPDSFKECLSAKEVANVIAEGIVSEIPNAECVCIPVADGGEGTLEALVDATNGRVIPVEVTGPLGNVVNAQFGVLGDQQTAVVEMASASGIELVAPCDRNPLKTTSFGTGELIKRALEENITKIIVAIGGSATNDGGVGMLQALGVKFTREDGREIGFGGGELGNIAHIDISNLDPRLQNVEILTACDVDNPLTGERGASAVFGPQKGATPDMVEALDANLRHYANCIQSTISRDIEFEKGAGAAGGMGAALLAFLNARLMPGIDIVLDTVEFEQKLMGADLVITGEGRIDSQTIHGKTPVGVSRLAQKHNIKTVALAGSVGEGIDVLKSAGIIACFSIVPTPCELSEAIAAGRENLFKTAKQLAGVVAHFNK
ncbi:glycerate kinase [Vibrio alfacsensis]|uniref:glycerate kinase family protein n=1 Tax=Vibrio alfacsensis TaxID=1074311 RepID=UPI002ADDECB8|nr:glycerate kinase [Vibrio alfacsensis]WQE75605.1 glycerate kinase [Vibrio alfacsensis]